MSAEVPLLRGRVLVVGARDGCDALLEQLSGSGYQCAAAASAEGIRALAEELHPEAILVSGAGKQAQEALAAIREDARLRELPVLADVTRTRADLARKLTVDDWVTKPEELGRRLEGVLRARRAVERDERSRRRMEMLLEITQAATSSLELEQVLRLAVTKVGEVIATDRCSVVLVDGFPLARTARLVATYEDPHLTERELELARYPELRRAFETRQPVLVEDAQRDPLMGEVRKDIAPLGVRSILVQPLICEDELVGALFLRLGQEAAAGFGREDQEFARAVAASIANSIRNARLHTALKRKREELELAYVDRYRELTEANRRLKELNRLKDEIIAICSHDVRAPLNILLGHGRLLMDTELDPAQRMSGEAMLKQGKKILGLVESLLEKGRGEAARVSLEPRLLDVAELCVESARELEILAKERGIAVRAECPESLMSVGDEVKLHEVLQNLVTNAIKHAKDAGHVVVRAQRQRRPDGDVARVVVQDDGQGIPAHQLHLVFDRYRHGQGGTGLGLAICKEFVELHGGEIWAETPREGGCAFVFTLPLAREKEAPGPGVVAGAGPQPASEPGQAQPRVLVVEDEPEIAQDIAEALKSRFRVEVARDGAEGVAKARALQPDLVVMDVFLPRIDGLDAAAALRASSDTADIPIILMSTHAGVADRVRSLELGAVDYLNKPFQPLELLARSERLLKLRRAEQDLARASTLLKRTGADPVTGLADGRGVLARLEQEVSRARRYGRPLALAVLQPESAVGEGLLSLADVLRRRLRTPDVLGHLGGGVFALLLPECGLDDARRVVGRLVPELERAAGTRYKPGLVDAGVEGDAPERLLERLGAAAPRGG